MGGRMRQLPVSPWNFENVTYRESLIRKELVDKFSETDNYVPAILYNYENKDFQLCPQRIKKL